MEITNNRHYSDMFEHIIGNADSYSSIEEFQSKVKYYENIARSSPPTEERFNIQLAILSLKIQRIATELDGKSVIDQLEDIDKYVKADTLLESKFKLVYGQYCSMIKEDFLEARRIFNELLIKFQKSEHHLLYAVVSKALCVVYMMLGETSKAEELAQDAVSTFRRFGGNLLYAHSLSNYGVLKKNTCQYVESEKMLKKCLRIYLNHNISDGEASCYNNLGTVKKKLGEWDDAIHYYEKATYIKERIYSTVAAPLKHKVNLEHLYLLKRKYNRAENNLKGLFNIFSKENALRQKAIALEFLGELYIEKGEYRKAKEHLSQAENTARKIAPESDVMTEVKRRQAQLYLLTGEIDRAKRNAFHCIHLSKKICDKHEMGAALRILGEIYLSLKNPRKAVSAFQASIHTLKGIHECYELMRSCIAYSEYLISIKSREAEVYLLEARQLCKKLKLDYFMSKIMLLMGRHELIAHNYTEARSFLREAEVLYENLQACDQKKIKSLIHDFHKKLEGAVLKISMDSAEKFKAIGKIYEEARFPLEEARPELAMEVVRNAGAESLFLVRQASRGCIVTLAYNISIREAKQIVGTLNQRSGGTLFKINTHPKIHKIGDEKAVICVPGQNGLGNILCAVVKNSQDFTPRQFEFLFASVDVMERLAEEYSTERITVGGDEFIQEGTRNLSHPGGSFKRIITLDREMIKIIHLAKRASNSDAPILLEGETGVGKELFARAIHESSRRRMRGFIVLNAGGVPVNFLESQLFGYVKGAYTDACIDRMGLLEESSGGSLFFDEIGDMQEELQVKLLRLLENGEFRRLGENTLRHADVRVISATNKDLSELVEKGSFRKDLYYRMAAVRFQIPPLRARKRDIELLVRYFLRETVNQLGSTDREIGIDMKALEAFEIYEWPGNVRELHNEIVRIISLMGEGEVIRFGMLSDSIKAYFNLHSDKGMLERSVERYERRLILKALENNDWNRIRTAAEIGIPRTTLIGKMKRLNIVS